MTCLFIVIPCFWYPSSFSFTCNGHIISIVSSQCTIIHLHLLCVLSIAHLCHYHHHHDYHRWSFTTRLAELYQHDYRRDRILRKKRPFAARQMATNWRSIIISSSDECSNNNSSIDYELPIFVVSWGEVCCVHHHATAISERQSSMMAHTQLTHNSNTQTLYCDDGDTMSRLRRTIWLLLCCCCCHYNKLSSSTVASLCLPFTLLMIVETTKKREQYVQNYQLLTTGSCSLPVCYQLGRIRSMYLKIQQQQP